MSETIMGGAGPANDMPMVDMKRGSSDKSMGMAPEQESGYPCGLCITLESEDLEKLGIKEPPRTGETLDLDAIAKVTQVAIDGSLVAGKYRITLQITNLAVCACAEDPAEALYSRKPGY